jgi:fatty-acyl-CoA synthase
MTVHALVDAHARSRPRAPAIHYAGTVVDFASLAERSRRVATALAELGIGAGDRVALYLPNTPAYLVLYLALCRLGAIAVAVNTRFRSSEVQDIVGRSGAKSLVLWPGFRGIDFASILADVESRELPALKHIVLYQEDDAALPPKLLGRPTVGYHTLEARPPLMQGAGTSQSPCNIFTTSGTTKAPKFVLHRQAGIARHAQEVATRFGLARPESAVLAVMPLCGVFGFNAATSALAAGCPMHLMPAFDAGIASRLIREQRITDLQGSDDMVAQLLDAVPDPVPYPSLRGIGYAIFNPALEDIAARAERRGLRLNGLYGMSEVQALYARFEPDLPLATRNRGGGHPISPDAQVRVRDPESGALLPHGKPGELELAGPSLFAEYFGNAEATAAAMTADGFLRTGDLGFTEPDGAFVYIGRMGDALRLGGFLVSPSEIEAYLQTHPAVDGAQVVGVTVGGKAQAFAFVVPKAGIAFDAAAIRAHCLKGLARFKVPAGIVPLDEFPSTKSANGVKIQRNKLRDMADEWAQSQAEVRA